MTLWVGICRVIQNVQKYFFVDTGNFFRTKFEKWHLAIFESRKLNFLASRASPTEIQQGLKGGRLCQLSIYTRFDPFSASQTKEYIWVIWRWNKLAQFSKIAVKTFLSIANHLWRLRNLVPKLKKCRTLMSEYSTIKERIGCTGGINLRNYFPFGPI